MSRFLLPVAFALLLPSCGGSDVFCSYAASGVVAGCADYSFSGDSGGDDVTDSLEEACTSGGGTIVGSCSSTNALGTCTITDSAGSATVSAAEYLYAVDGQTAAEAQAKCESLSGTDGLSATWSTP